MKKQAIAIRHVPFEDLGNLGHILEQNNYAVNYVEAASGLVSQIDPLNPELIVILGGPIGAYDDVDYPFLKDELTLLERRLKADRPTLGICLGAQLMARSLGAKVYPGQEKEIGWFPIQLSEQGEKSSLSYIASTPVLHWHGDTFDLPNGAIHLASSSKYKNQAFAWGECGLALQFHPEVTAQGLEHWLIGHACEISTTPNLGVSQLRKDTDCYAQTLEAHAALFWQAWLKRLEQRLG